MMGEGSRGEMEGWEVDFGEGGRKREGDGIVVGD